MKAQTAPTRSTTNFYISGLDPASQTTNAQEQKRQRSKQLSGMQYKIRRRIKLPWIRLRLSLFKKVHCAGLDLICILKISCYCYSWDFLSLVRHWMRRGVDELQACKQAPANFQRSVEWNCLVMILRTFEKAMRWAFGCWKARLFHAKSGNKRSLRPQQLPRRDVRLQKETGPQESEFLVGVIFDTYDLSTPFCEKTPKKKTSEKTTSATQFVGKLPNIRHLNVTLFIGKYRYW